MDLGRTGDNVTCVRPRKLRKVSLQSESFNKVSLEFQKNLAFALLLYCYAK